MGSLYYDQWEKDNKARPQPVLKRFFLKKTIQDVSVVPNVGEAITDPMWEDKPHEVSIKYFDYDKDECHITVAPFYIPKGSAWEDDFERIAQLHGWEVIGITDQP